MARPPKTWVITDTHFNHQELIDAGLRPNGYQYLIISACRRLLAPQDTLIHLGDVIFSEAGALTELLARIPGRKVLVKGNHDKNSDAWYMNHGFAFVCDGLLIGDVYLSHMPQRVFPGRLNLHGHFHNFGTREAEFDFLTDRHRLLAIELTNYAPVMLSDYTRPMEDQHG